MCRERREVWRVEADWHAMKMGVMVEYANGWTCRHVHLHVFHVAEGLWGVRACVFVMNVHSGGGLSWGKRCSVGQVYIQG